MSAIAKFFWAVLAGVVMLWVGGGTPVDGSPPEETVPILGCPPGEFRQGPVGDEPCGPTDLCSGDGVTTNWALYPCDEPVDETVPSTTGPLVVCLDTFEEDDISACREVVAVGTAPTPPQMLPATGGEQWEVLLIGGLLIGLGIVLLKARR